MGLEGLPVTVLLGGAPRSTWNGSLVATDSSSDAVPG